jgi:hypothetical protein
MRDRGQVHGTHRAGVGVVGVLVRLYIDAGYPKVGRSLRRGQPRVDDETGEGSQSKSMERLLLYLSDPLPPPYLRVHICTSIHLPPLVYSQ